MTCGEPAGIGPDICIKLAQEQLFCHWIAIVDPQLIEKRADQLGLPIRLNDIRQNGPVDQAGTLNILPVELVTDCLAGYPLPANASYVLKCLDIAVDLCKQDSSAAMVTGPVHKAVINQAGHSFTGHTEYLAQLCDVDLPVMMLVTDNLRVALVTTHMPLSQVSQSITRPLLEKVITIIDHDLKKYFSLASPVIHVCGLNPHAGEDGHLGFEEQEIIFPVIEKLKQKKIGVSGPFSADTVFTGSASEKADVILAMYHDQGLPVLKYKGFGKAVNITLGLPIVRTSVDHGTALKLAGTGKADSGSMLYAMKLAYDMLPQ